MAKKVYYVTALMVFLLGVPILNYFAYSNQLEAITILDKSWTDFCNATSWNNPADVICEVNIRFIVNEDTFWYPYIYDPYGRQAPATFEPSVKEWRLERTWGKGYREIPLDKVCSGTWCGAKKDGSKTLYSVAWREGKTYETRITAIKNNPFDNINWSFGIDPIWYGWNITKLCIWRDEIQNVYGNKTYEYTCLTNTFSVNASIKKAYCKNDTLNINGTNSVIFEYNYDYGYLANKTIYWNNWEKTGTEIIQICDKWTGVLINGKTLDWEKYGFQCSRPEIKVFECDRCDDDGNCDGIWNSGESGCRFELANGTINKECRGDTPNIRDIIKRFKVE